MRERKIVIGMLLVFSLRISCQLFAQEKSAADADLACRRFVQEFYDWYVPKAVARHHGPAWVLALKEKKTVFSPDLFRKLEEDSEAQAKAKGDLVGLDFDPFLNSQDPSEHFAVQSVTRKGDTYWVELRGINRGKPQETVTPEVRLRDNGWEFVNIHYGKNEFSSDSNLLEILDKLRQDRLKDSQ